VKRETVVSLQYLVKRDKKEKKEVLHLMVILDQTELRDNLETKERWEIMVNSK
jgi:hypothetical protein